MKLLLRLRRIVLCVLLVTALPGLIIAQDLSAPLPVDPEVVMGKFENGLTYYIRTNRKPEKKVELRLVVKAGSILEDNDQQGLAHFMEHMNFNGTTNFKKNDLVSYLQSIGVQFGADLNAYTSFDQTVYILPIPTDKPGNLEKGFQIIEDWAHNALLTDKDIDDERGVVLEESRLGKGAQDRMRQKYFPKLAEGSLYADRLPIGKDDVIKNSKYERTRSFYRDWYRPNLQAVIVVGDIDVPTAKQLIKKHFGSLVNPPNERPRKYVDVTPRKAPEAMVVTDKEASGTVMLLNYPYMKKRDEVTVGDYRANMVRNLGLQVINRRISDLTKSGNPPFAFAGVGFDDLIFGYEALSAYVYFTPGEHAKALNAITAELAKAKKFGFTESEVELARKEMLSTMEKYYNERTTTESKDYVEEYIRAFLEGEPFPGIENEYKYYQKFLPAITLADVNAEAQKWMPSQNVFTLIMAPDKKEIKLPTDKELLDLTIKGLQQDIKQEEEKKIGSTLMEVKPKPGKVVSTHKEEGLDATTYTLSNGIKVTIKPTDFKSDEILLKAVKKGGSGKYGVADRNNVLYATDVADAMGFGSFTPTDMEKVLAGKKIELEEKINEIDNQLVGKSTVKDFEALMQVVYLCVMQPRKDLELFNAYKEKQKSVITFMSANPQAAFVDTTFKVLYNNHPLGRRVIPKPEDFDGINLERAMQIYKEELGSADGFHFVIVGNIQPEVAIPLIETYIGSIPATGKPAAFKDNGVRPVKGNKELKFKKGKDPKSLILAIYSGEIAYSEDLALKTQAVAEILNIKVIEELREKMGKIYGGGFRGSVSRDPYSRFSVQLQLPCGPQSVDTLLIAANHEIKMLIQNGPSSKDLEKVKSQWREKYRTDVKENQYWADKLESTLFWGKDKDRVLKYESYIDKLTPADVQQTAKKLFEGTNKFVSVLYPES